MINTLKKGIMYLFILLCTGMLCCLTNTKKQEIKANATFDEANITTKVGMLSDMHIGYAGSDTKYLNALDKLIKYTGGLDALANCGDMTQNGTDAEVQELKKLTESKINIQEIPYIFNYGNHDTYWSGCMNTQGFKESFGDDYFKFDVDKDSIALGNRHVVVNGIHFVSVQTQTYMPGNNTFSPVTLEWLNKTLKEITTNDPLAYVIVTGHSPVTNTIFGSDANTDIGNWGSNTQLGEIFKNYSQVVYFSGHTHYSVHDERAIHQGDFTSVLVGSSADLELATGTVEGKALPNRRDYSTGLVLEFDANKNLRITRYDFIKDEQIKQAWVLPCPDSAKSHLTHYTNKRATVNNTKPVFTEGELVLSKVNNSTLGVTYPKAVDDDMVFMYEINVYDGNNTLLKSIKSMNNYYDYPNQASLPATRSNQVSGVTVVKPYTVEVIAYDSWGNASDPLRLTIEDTTEADKAKAKVVDDMIDALGKIDETKKDALDKVLEEYKKLNFEQKVFVEKKDVLLKAVEAMNKLYLFESQITNQVTLKDVYESYPSKASFANNDINGLDITYSRGSYNDTVTLSKKVNLKDFSLSIANIQNTKSTFDFCLLFSSTPRDEFDNSKSKYPLLLWFDFIAGTVKVYPHVGGTLVIKDEILKYQNFGGARLDIDIVYLEDGNYQMTVSNFLGSATGLIPSANVAQVNRFTNIEDCYLQFTPWESNVNLSFTVLSYGSEKLGGAEYKVSDIKNISVLENNLKTIPNEITKEQVSRVVMLKEIYDKMPEFIKGLINDATTAKLLSLFDQLSKFGVLELVAPVVSISEDILSIEEVNGAESYDIYVNGEYLTTTPDLTFDLSTLGLSDGTYQIKVRAYSEQLGEGPMSESVEYVITKEVVPAPSKGCTVSLVKSVIASLAAVSLAFICLKKK